MKQPTFAKWFVVCTAHKESCPQFKGVSPNGKGLKIEPLPARFKNQPAFYFKYNGGLRLKHVLRHYPTKHGFKVIPIPKGITVMNSNGVYITEDLKLEQLNKDRQIDICEEDQEKGIGDDDETGPGDSPNQSSLIEETEEFYGRGDVYEPNLSKRVKVEGPQGFDEPRPRAPKQDFQPNGHHENFSGQEQEEQIPIKLPQLGPQNKHKLRKAGLKLTANQFLRPKTSKSKSRKCKEVREVDRTAQCEEAVKHLFKRVETIEQRQDSSEAQQAETIMTLNGALETITAMNKKAKIALSNLQQEVQALREPTKRESDFSQLSTQSNSLSFPELAKI